MKRSEKKQKARAQASGRCIVLNDWEAHSNQWKPRGKIQGYGEKKSVREQLS